MSVFRTNFIRLCNANGKTPSTAAFEAGLSKGAPSNWESRNSDPRADSLLKIAEYFGVSTAYLLTEHPADEPVPLIERKNMWQNVVEPDELDILQELIAEKKAKKILTAKNSDEFELTDTERDLIMWFRNLPEEKREVVRKLQEAF